MTLHADSQPTVQDLDIHNELFWQDAPALYRDLRRQCPVAHSPHYGGFSLFTKHEDVARAARDDGTFSSHRDEDGSRPGFDGIAVPRNPYGAGMIEMDPPEFNHYRRLLNPLFAPPRVQAMRPRILEVVNAAIDDVIERGECDLILDVTSPVPATITMERLGLPLERCERYSTILHEMLATPLDAPERPGVEAGLFALFGELQELIDERRVTLRDDWLSVLVAGEVDGHAIPDRMLLENSFLLLAGGVDTTTQLTSQALRYLAQHPDDRTHLCEHPELLPSACEEFLRFFSPVQMFARTVTRETTVSGTELKAGDRVMLCWAAANRDPDEFEQPDEMILDRSPNRHLAFGVGVHRCIGSHLARAQFEILVGEILRRMPDYEIDETRVQPYRDRSVNGIISMPTTFTPGKRSAC